MIRFVNRSLACLCAVVLFTACSSSDNGNGGTPQDQFDRQAMLTNWADNIIIPALADLESKLAVLDDAANSFAGSPDQAGLDQLRSAWLDAYATWQYAEMFNIGKAEELQYNFQMNVYPVSTTDVMNNIASGTYDLSSVNNQDAVGFPAVDYLIHGIGVTDAEIIDQYVSSADAAGYKTYLTDLTARMVALTGEVAGDWSTSYRDQFVNNTANTATGAVNKLTNDFIFYYEKGLRANKIGIPAGVFSTQPLPDRVEAYYGSVYSKMLAMTALNAVQDFFNGKAYGGSSVGVSFDDYLDYLESIQGGDGLAGSINGQFNSARSQMEMLGDDLSQQVTTDNAAMTRTYDELQKAVVLLKVDMVQKMNITIDYVDADGD
ncbi:imelysin family protein [Robertkochia sediminum]|uniref:imelysin family protein n=1 Tax=Robertkochia sediminum TaxID=2785326 RepID=UPI00193187EF|nr:imelysin family protein [Robertkochia sediminum]MBL7472538.1 imelysin family protein [Robertkochia sediminum]